MENVCFCFFFLWTAEEEKKSHVITSLAWQLLTNQMPRPASVAALLVACSVPTWAAVQLCVVSLKVAAAATTLRCVALGRRPWHLLTTFFRVA